MPSWIRATRRDRSSWLGCRPLISTCLCPAGLTGSAGASCWAAWLIGQQHPLWLRSAREKCHHRVKRRQMSKVSPLPPPLSPSARQPGAPQGHLPLARRVCEWVCALLPGTHSPQVQTRTSRRGRSVWFRVRSWTQTGPAAGKARVAHSQAQRPSVLLHLQCSSVTSLPKAV